MQTPSRYTHHGRRHTLARGDALRPAEKIIQSAAIMTRATLPFNPLLGGNQGGD
ncbi:MAG: hypothetical protein LAO06_21155 [Acidobacteriia bacterium]|nr:hypothetical protein [Terriglobia bacterium]